MDAVLEVHIRVLIRFNIELTRLVSLEYEGPELEECNGRLESQGTIDAFSSSSESYPRADLSRRLDPINHSLRSADSTRRWNGT